MAFRSFFFSYSLNFFSFPVFFGLKTNFTCQAGKFAQKLIPRDEICEAASSRVNETLRFVELGLRVFV